MHSLRHTIRWLLIALAYVVIYLALQPGLWNGKTFLGWDIVRQGWPNLEAVYSSFAAGELPLWNPHEKCGFSIVGDPEVALFYPLTWLLCLVRGLFGGGVGLMLLQVLVHVAIGATGVHYYLQRHRVPSGARWVGGAAYVLCTRLAKSKDQIALGTVVWFPWMMIALEEAVERPRWRHGVLLGVVLAVDLLAGYPPNVFRNLLALAIVFGFEIHGALAGRADKRRYLKQLGLCLGVGAAVMIALCLPMLLAFSESFSASARAGMRMDEVLRSTFPPHGALQLFAPGLRARGAFFNYIGLLPALAALVALVKLERRQLLWLGVAVFFLLLAAGGRSPLLPALSEAVPIFAYWRVPEQYLACASFFLCVLGATGLGALLQHPPQVARWWVDRLCGAAFLLALASLVITRLEARPHAELIGSAQASILLLAATWFCLRGMTASDGRQRRMALWCGLVVLLVDLGTQARPIYKILEPKPRLAGREAVLDKLTALRAAGRLANDRYFSHRVGMRRELRELFGRNTALITERYRRYSSAARKSYTLLAAANVRYVSGRSWPVIKRQAGDKARQLNRQLGELTAHAPLAYWTEKVQLVKGAPAALRAMKRGTPGEQAIVELPLLDGAARARLSRLPGKRAPVTAEVLAFERNRLRLRVKAPAAGVLVVTEAYDKGWQATVDGQPQPVLRANYLFRGVWIGSAGAHEVELRYRPRAVLAGIAVFAVTAAGLLALALLGLVRRWRRRDR